MPLGTLLPLALALGIAFVPVWLLRDPGGGRAQDVFVASQPTRPEVVRNASIAYGLRMAAFGPLFAWGASGDLLPALIAAAAAGLGIWLIDLLRRPLVEFLDDALGRDGSVTVHAFIARQHGGDPRVRVLAASLTLFALYGLLVGEALALAAFLKPMLPGAAPAVYALVLGAPLWTVLPALLAGRSGVMHSAQLQLGLLYLGLFGTAALLLYLHLSALTPMPPHGTLAVVLVAVCGVILLVYRRSKYVDTERLRAVAPAAVPGAEPVLAPDASPVLASDAEPAAAAIADPIFESALARLLSRTAKILNPSVSVLLVLAVAVAALDLHAAGLPRVVDDAAAALQAGTRVPGVGLVALFLLPLLYPLVDSANWQGLAALRREAGGGEPGGDSARLRGVFRMAAVESVLAWLLICMLGAIAVGALETPGGVDAVQTVVAQLASADDEITRIALALLLICVSAVVLSTMSTLCSASLCTFRYDVLPALRPELAARPGQPAQEESAARLTLLAGGGLGLAVAVGFCVADAFFRISLASDTFLAALLAVGCAQLALVPLVLGPIVGRRLGGRGVVSAGGALAVIGIGAASGVAAVVAHLATGAGEWLWAAVPICLGSGLAAFGLAGAAARGPPPD